MPNQERSESAENQDPGSSAKQSSDPAQATRDPEFEIPDPEQVERDREQAEEIYGKPSSAEKPGKPKENVA